MLGEHLTFDIYAPGTPGAQVLVEDPLRAQCLIAGYTDGFGRLTYHTPPLGDPPPEPGPRTFRFYIGAQHAEVIPWVLGPPTSPIDPPGFGTTFLTDIRNRFVLPTPSPSLPFVAGSGFYESYYLSVLNPSDTDVVWNPVWFELGRQGTSDRVSKQTDVISQTVEENLLTVVLWAAEGVVCFGGGATSPTGVGAAVAAVACKAFVVDSAKLAVLAFLNVLADNEVINESQRQLFSASTRLIFVAKTLYDIHSGATVILEKIPLAILDINNSFRTIVAASLEIIEEHGDRIVKAIVHCDLTLSIDGQDVKCDYDIVIEDPEA